MKKYTLTAFLIITFASFVLISCGKDDPAPVPKTKTEMMMSGTWKFKSATAGGFDVSGLPQIACFVDNTVTFSTATTGTISEGATVCTPSTAGSFTWSFNTGETEINISTTLITGGSGTFTLVSISETQLVVSQVISGQTVIVTFIH